MTATDGDTTESNTDVVASHDQSSQPTSPTGQPPPLAQDTAAAAADGQYSVTSRGNVSITGIHTSLWCLVICLRIHWRWGIIYWGSMIMSSNEASNRNVFNR